MPDCRRCLILSRHTTIQEYGYRPREVTLRFSPDQFTLQMIFRIVLYLILYNTFTIGKPTGKRPSGKIIRRWEDNIRMDLKETKYQYEELS